MVSLPFCSRPWCLPVLARLHVPGRGKAAGKARKRDAAPASAVSGAAELVALLAGAFPGRRIDVVADAHYHGPALGTPGDLAAAAAWTPARVRAYGRVQDQDLAEVTCLWYGCLDTIPVRVILARSTRATLALVTTDLDTPAAELVERYAGRREIEQAFADARTVLGAGEARTRTRRAVQRTVPFALLVHTLVVTWYARHGYDRSDITGRRAAEPWYRAKAEPAFEDMLTKLRRTLIARAPACSGVIPFCVAYD